MDIRNPAGLLDSLLYTNTQSQQQGQGAAAAAAASKKRTSDKAERQDIIALSGQSQLIAKANAEKSAQKIGADENRPPPRSNGLVKEETTKIENGFRRTQQFDRGEGKSFTRLEEVTNTPDRSKRIVIQQNASGSTTALETILDRQADNTFRLTQRYTNEVGETQTNIQYNVTSNNADVLLGRASSPDRQTPPPYQSPRGTQFNVVT